MLKKGLLVDLDGLIILSELHESIGLTSHELTSLNKVVILSLALLNAEITFFDALFKIFHFEPTSSFVRVEGGLPGALVNSFLIDGESFLKFSSLVDLISLSFDCFGLLLEVNFIFLLLWESFEFSLLSLGLLFFLLFLELLFGLFKTFFLLLFCLHLLFLNIHEIDSSENFEACHHTSILLTSLQKHLRISFHLVPHSNEHRVLEEFCGSWISPQFGISFGSSEHVSTTSHASCSRWRLSLGLTSDISL